MTNGENGRGKTKISWVGKIGWFLVFWQVLYILTILYQFKSPYNHDLMWMRSELSTIQMSLSCGIFPTLSILMLIAHFLGCNILCPFACFLGWLEYCKSKTGNAIIITSIICALVTVILSLVLARYYDSLLLTPGVAGIF